MDRSDGRSSRRPISRRLLLALVPLLVALEVPGVVELLQRPELGWKLRQTTVMVVEPRGPAADAGVQVGDRVTALGGEPVESWADVRAALARHRPGDVLGLALLRDGDTASVEIAAERPSFDGLVLTLSMRLSALTFLFLGFITYLRRDDALGRTFFVTCVLLAFPFLDLPSLADRMWMRTLIGVRDGAQVLLGAFLLRFLLIFPEGASVRPDLYVRQRWILAPAVALVPLHIASAFAPRASARSGFETMLLAATTLIFVGYVVAAVVVFARKVRRRDRWVRGSKLRLASLGMGAGVLPLTLAALARWLAPTHALPVDEWAVLMLPLVPASFSFALLRSGAMDLATLTRQLFLAMFVAGPVVLLAWVGAGELAEHVVPAARPAVYGAVLATLVVAGITLRGPLRFVARGVDRALYPERRRVRALADRIGRTLTERREPAPLIDHFVADMKELVETEMVLVLEPHDDRWIPTDAHPEGFDDLSIDGDTSLVEWIVRSREIVVLDPERVDADPRFGPTARAWRQRADAHVVAPLVVAGEVTALLALGGRVGDRDYGALHLYHIDHLCRQAGAALQNARLHEEDLQRERMRTELTLAKEIQEQLLPAAPLEVDGLTVCGRTVSSRSVGGDLHDHFVLSDGRVVMVVADASGKGIPASLLTSGVRTAMRETIRPDLGLDEAIAHVNRHVHGMTHVGNFVALFCAVIDPNDGLTEYCVAGIEPPLWVRTANPRAERLTRGGAVLGVDPNATFHVGTICLAPGDTLVAYSDGVIDEEDVEGDEFGTDRLVALLGNADALDPGELLTTIFDRVKGHAGGEPVDDTTVVVARRSAEVRMGTKRALA